MLVFFFVILTNNQYAFIVDIKLIYIYIIYLFNDYARENK